MSKLEQLIEELCPDGVEYKTLGEVLKIRNGKDYKNLNKGDIPVYGTGGIMTHIDSFAYNKPSVLIPRKGSIDKLYYVDVPFWTVDTIFWTEINSDIIEPKFVYYYLQTQHLEVLNTGGGVPSLTQSVLNKVQIPVPPLAIQREIVRILDNFTELTKELTKELTARKTQYEYYRNELLMFDDNVKYKMLGEICDIKNGYTPLKANSEYWKNGTIPWFRMEDIRQNGRVLSDSVQHITTKAVKCGRLFSENSIVIATTATVGEHALITVKSLGNQQLTFLTIKEVNKKVLHYKFLFYYCFILDNWCKVNVKGGGLPAVDMTKFAKFKIPLPPLTEQLRIISILDRFDTLTNDISNGLPAEIKARRKQYEYYRDKLLTFK